MNLSTIVAKEPSFAEFEKNIIKLNNLRLVLILIDENRLISELFVYTESEVKAAHSPWDFESVF
ncbi:MAG TPA: hypothetical protein DDW71_03270 [Lactobacillus sp.]|nr:hypothetical protein [Lactobacillus sp.]